MPYEDRNGGVMFTNKHRRDESAPVMTGKLDVEGKPYQLSVWPKKSAKGLDYFTLAVRPAIPPEQRAPARRPTPRSKSEPVKYDHDFNDELPWVP